MKVKIVDQFFGQYDYLQCSKLNLKPVKMKRLLLIVFCTILLAACGGNSQDQPEATEEDTPNKELSTDLQAQLEADTAATIRGLYTTGTHDESWAVIIDNRKREWFASAVKFDGMLPPDNIFDYPDDIQFDYFEYELDPDNLTFNSAWGSGRIEVGEESMLMVFTEREGIHGPETDGAETALTLHRQQQVLSPEGLVGFYRGSTWHSQGFVVIIEEQDGQLKVKGSQTDGGEPTMETVESYPEEFNFVDFATFDLNDDLTEFNSDWGKGHFMRSPYGFRLTFEHLPGAYDPATDEEDAPVRLTKVEEE